MNEIGNDISGHRSKSVDGFPREFDQVITVCGNANESCPVFPAGLKGCTGRSRIRLGFRFGRRAGGGIPQGFGTRSLAAFGRS
jgi:arsenate reductase